MGIMIIDPEGNTIHEEKEDRNRENREEDVDNADPRLEVIIPNSRQIQEQQQEEQVIIATIIGHPLA